jgi:Putative adhesin
MKRLLTLSLAALALGITVPAAAESYREQSQRSFDVAGLSGLRAENTRGRTELKKSDDGQIHLTALKTARADDQAAAHKLAAEITVEVARESGTLVIRVRYPRRMTVDVDVWELMRGKTVPRADLTLALEVPDRFPVSLTTTSGNVESDQLSGPQTIHTVSGDVTVRNATGNLELNTTSGDVTVSNVSVARVGTVSGDVEAETVRQGLRVRTTNGDVTVHAARDSLALQTVSGDIDVDRAPRGIGASTSNGNVTVGEAAGPVSISTSNGDVHIDLVGPMARTDISTATGDIDLGLGERLGCRVEARTGSGEIDVQVPLEVQNVSRQWVSGVVRGGSTPLSLRTSTGDITLVSGRQ